MPSPPVGRFTEHEGGTPDGAPLVAGRFDGEHILVPLLTRELPLLTDQLKVAATLARMADASLTVINPGAVPERTLDAYHHEVTDGDDTALLEWVVDRATEPCPQIDAEFRSTSSVVRGVVQTVRRHDIDTLILSGKSRADRLRKGVTEQIAAHADADVVVVNGQAGFRQTPSILLPVAGGPHSGFAADVARSVALGCDAWIDILHVIDENAPTHKRERADELVGKISQQIDRPETTTTWVLEAPDTTEAIVEQSQYYGLTVLGAPTTGRLRRFVFGSTNATVRANAGSVVLSARNNTPTSGSG